MGTTQMNEQTCDKCIGHYLLKPYAQGKTHEPNGSYAGHSARLTEWYGPYKLGDTLPTYIAELFFCKICLPVHKDILANMKEMKE